VTVELPTAAHPHNELKKIWDSAPA